MIFTRVSRRLPRDERININNAERHESLSLAGDSKRPFVGGEMFDRVGHSPQLAAAISTRTNPRARSVRFSARLIPRHEDRGLPQRRRGLAVSTYSRGALVRASIFVSLHQSHYRRDVGDAAGTEGAAGGGSEVGKGCRPRENVIWIQSYESNRNSAERTRHRLEIRFEFAGGDGVASARARARYGGCATRRGGKRRQRRRGDGRPQGSSFIHGAFTRYPRKADRLLRPPPVTLLSP